MAREEELRSILDARAAGIGQLVGSGGVAVSVYDYASRFSWSHRGDRWFHAASTIKIALLAAVFDAVEARRFTLDDRLHVRNRFLSAADRQPFRVELSRDADGDVHASIGRTLTISELARHMIVTSSNLATNLLFDLIGLEQARRTIARRGIDGIDFRRGVEDDRAFQAGCVNRVTADGLVALLRTIFERRECSDESATAMIEILGGQRFTGTIAPGLPDAIRASARVAHKTGEISTVTHDAGFVFLPNRPPYVVALLSESDGDAASRTAALVAASAAVYDAVAAAGEPTWP